MRLFFEQYNFFRFAFVAMMNKVCYNLYIYLRGENVKTNFHTHTVYCDGKNTPEEMVLSAIKNGFDSIGFSGHGFTDFAPEYCMKDTEGYINEIKTICEKYKNDIRIYLGIEEESFCLTDRARFDYIIGSCHYILRNGKYYPIDSNPQCFKECLSVFGGDPLSLAEAYYDAFCGYILRRKPDIIGHFDLITKFDETEAPLFLNNAEYIKLATEYIEKANGSGCIFEVNTGAISRGYRKTPYPQEELLQKLLKLDAKIILSSDSHSADTLDFAFDDTKKYLYDIGFRYVYVLSDDGFCRDFL